MIEAGKCNRERNLSLSRFFSRFLKKKNTHTREEKEIQEREREIEQIIMHIIVQLISRASILRGSLSLATRVIIGAAVRASKISRLTGHNQIVITFNVNNSDRG